MSAEIKPGEWVRAWGQVVSTEDCHPDDVVVEFFSHNEQWRGHVVRDRVQVTTEQPADVPPCNSLVSLGEDGTYMRCARHHNHALPHRRDDVEWTTADGHVEDA